MNTSHFQVDVSGENGVENFQTFIKKKTEASAQGKVYIAKAQPVTSSPAPIVEKIVSNASISTRKTEGFNQHKPSVTLTQPVASSSIPAIEKAVGSISTPTQLSAQTKGVKSPEDAFVAHILKKQAEDKRKASLRVARSNSKKSTESAEISRSASVISQKTNGQQQHATPSRVSTTSNRSSEAKQVTEPRVSRTINSASETKQPSGNVKLPVLDPELLRDGWEVLVLEEGPQAGKVYYQNNITKTTQWEMPVVVSRETQLEPVDDTDGEAEEGLAMSMPGPLGAGWVSFYDPGEGKAFFKDAYTGIISENRPTEASPGFIREQQNAAITSQNSALEAQRVVDEQHAFSSDIIANTNTNEHVPVITEGYWPNPAELFVSSIADQPTTVGTEGNMNGSFVISDIGVDIEGGKSHPKSPSSLILSAIPCPEVLLLIPLLSHKYVFRHQGER